MSAFDGIRVLDCSQGLSGPMAAMLLADFGAEVLKLESPQGDRAKDWPGYVAWNRNKHRLTLDLAAEADRERFDNLLAGADVVVFDHGPSALAALGLGAAVLTAANPRLIHLWVPPYGTSGAWSDLPAHHASLTGLSGAAFRQGSYADQPIWYVAPLVQYAQATLAAAATGAALLERSANGLGQAVVVRGASRAAAAIRWAAGPATGSTGAVTASGSSSARCFRTSSPMRSRRWTWPALTSGTSVRRSRTSSPAVRATTGWPFFASMRRRPAPSTGAKTG